MSKKRVKHATKQCLQCLNHNPHGTKACAHCGKAFSRSAFSRMMSRIKNFFGMIGRKRMKSK